MLWVLDYQDQIASDLSVFHRVDDARGMPAHRYFALAPLLPAYAGALQARLERERANAPAAAPQPVSGEHSDAKPLPAAALRMKYQGLIE